MARAALLAMTIGAGAAVAETSGDVITLDETVISGNQELPKVLYIVPWQQPDGLPELGQDVHVATDALFRRLYPPAYRRELSYRKTLDEQESQE